MTIGREKCVTLSEGARQRGRPRKKNMKEVVDKAMNDSHIKPSDWSKWRQMNRGNCSDRSSDSDAES